MNIFIKQIMIAQKLKLIVLWLFLFFCVFAGNLSAQLNPASPVNWLYPDGNAQGTRNIIWSSGRQDLDSLSVKWATPSISGDVKPLIGNIINNGKISSSFLWAPNEIVAVIGGKLVVVDASGKTHTEAVLPPFVRDVTLLFDSLASDIGTIITRPLVLGLETLEFENLEDSLAYAYIGGFDHDADTVAIIKRLAINLRDYDPNIFASIKPVLGRKEGNEIFIYATVNMSKPTVDAQNPGIAPFFRGFTQFNTGTLLSTYPLPDVGDDPASRVTLGPEVNFSQPSYAKANGVGTVLLPTYPTPTMDFSIDNFVTDPTYPNIPYLLGFDISASYVEEGIFPRPLTDYIDPNGARPQIKSYFVNITDANAGDSLFILVAEEYKGIDGSTGRAGLHLCDAEGDPITLPGDNIAPPFYGGENHLWSVAVGDVDGTDSGNEWLPYYRNNPGNEIIVTQSSGDFAVPSSRLFVLRYYSGTEIDKPSPPNTYLYQLDTIASQRINGWVAAVNDLDYQADGKQEIILVDGSKLVGLRMKNYDKYEFRLGMPFDTVFTFNFPMQTISSVAIADLEGDGLNDIIVTTFDSTYVIGAVMTDILNVFEPDEQEEVIEYCAGDSVSIKWTNFVRGQDRVNIVFEIFEGGYPSGDTVLIAENVYNEGDTVVYDYVVDYPVFGYEGRFIVESAYNPGIIADASGTVSFQAPALNLDALEQTAYYAGDLIEISGSSLCVDSVGIYLSYESSTFWELMWVEPVSASGSFTIMTAAPCATFFECLAPDPDSLIYAHIIGFKSIYKDTSEAVPIRLMPAPFPVEWDTCASACPTLVFRWGINDMDFVCDSVSISVSANYGGTFSYIVTVPAIDGQYSWRIPLGLPEEALMRFCCESSCIRTDTLLRNFQPKFIDIVAPNPFRPPFEEVEIIYKVPEETNVTIRIFDANNRLVAEPVRNQSRLPGIAYCDRWSGVLSNGIIAANGIYYLSFEMSNGVREIYHIFVRK